MIWKSEKAHGERMEVVAGACEDVASTSARSTNASMHLQGRPEGRKAYSAEEVWRSLGIGKTLFYAHVAQGKIRTAKAGRRTLVPAKALDDFLAGE
jgi:excisionase family DNA binding protein